MNVLAVIRNPHAVQRIAGERWGAARTLPLDNTTRSRAQSLLAGTPYRDGSTNPGPLTLDQASDVLRWSTARIS